MSPDPWHVELLPTGEWAAICGPEGTRTAVVTASWPAAIAAVTALNRQVRAITNGHVAPPAEVVHG